VTNPAIGTQFNKVIFTSAPTLINGILPYALAQTPAKNNFNFATYGTLGIATAVSDFTDTFTGATATSNILIDQTTILPANNVSVNSVMFLGTPTLNLQNGATQFTLNLTSGGMITVQGGSTLKNGTVNFGTAEGVLLGNNSLQVDSVLAGS